MSKRNVFLRLWDYLRQYKGALFLAVFLKIFSSVMSVLEPFVLGLAITELTSNLLDMAHGVAGAHINISYIAIILVLYFVRGMGYELSSYGANFFITKAVQKTIHVGGMNRTSHQFILLTFVGLFVRNACKLNLSWSHEKQAFRHWNNGRHVYGQNRLSIRESDKGLVS